jgi:hypothetical protein
MAQWIHSYHSNMVFENGYWQMRVDQEVDDEDDGDDEDDEVGDVPVVPEEEDEEEGEDNF